jgi:hypothetical protein
VGRALAGGSWVTRLRGAGVGAGVGAAGAVAAPVRRGDLGAAALGVRYAQSRTARASSWGPGRDGARGVAAASVGDARRAREIAAAGCGGGRGAYCGAGDGLERGGGGGHRRGGVTAAVGIVDGGGLLVVPAVVADGVPVAVALGLPRPLETRRPPPEEADVPVGAQVGVQRHPRCRSCTIEGWGVL